MLNLLHEFATITHTNALLLLVSYYTNALLLLATAPSRNHGLAVRAEPGVQGYLAHKNPHSPLGPP